MSAPALLNAAVLEAPADDLNGSPTLADVMRELRELRAILESRPPSGKALSIQEAAKLLGVSESFLRKGIAVGKIAPTRQGRRVLLSAKEIERLSTKGT